MNLTLNYDFKKNKGELILTSRENGKLKTDIADLGKHADQDLDGLIFKRLK